MLYKKEKIQDLIPNRYPLMILDELNVNENIAKSKIVLRSDDWYLKCHFPGNPIMPFCLLIESMAQTFESIVCYNIKTNEIPLTTYIGESNIKCSSTVGDEIDIEAELVSFRHGLAKGNVKAYKVNNGEKVLLNNFDIIQLVPSRMK